MTATIIEFKPRESTAFTNMKQFFEVCTNIDTCNFYLDTVETLAANNEITEREMYTLRRIGRTKRIELAHPVKKEAEKVAAPGTYFYTPEMGEAKPDCQIEASLSYYGKHYHLKTHLDLKGRGITLNETRDNGVKWYTVTRRAYDLLKQQYTISYESRLD